MRFLTNKAAPKTGRKTAAGKRPQSRGKTRAKRSARRRAHPLLNWRTLRWSTAGLLVAGSLGSVVWLWQDGWFGRQANRLADAAYGLSADIGLKVTDLQLQGRVRSDAEAILAATAITRDMPILKLDLAEVRRNLESLPWVRRATVERQLPDVVFVRVTERVPLARWQLDGEAYVIDPEGGIIAGAEPRYFTHLPLVVGPEAALHAADLISVIESEPELHEQVTAAVWVSGRRWNVQLAGGIDVRLPEGNLDNAWAQLARVDREHQLLARDVIAIDLRLPDRLVVRTAPGAKPFDPNAPEGENT